MTLTRKISAAFVLTALSLASVGSFAQVGDVDVESLRPTYNFWSLEAYRGEEVVEVTPASGTATTTSFDIEGSRVEWTLDFAENSHIFFTLRGEWNNKRNLTTASAATTSNQSIETVFGGYITAGDSASVSIGIGRGELEDDADSYGFVTDGTYEILEVNYRHLLGAARNWELQQRARYDELNGTAYQVGLLYHTPASWSLGLTTTIVFEDYEYLTPGATRVRITDQEQVRFHFRINL